MPEQNMIRRRRVQTPFTYPVPVVTLAPGAAASATVSIESATDFIWFKSTYWADEDPVPGGGAVASTRVLPIVDLQIQVSGADRNMAQDFTPIENWFGTGEIPAMWPTPIVLLANSDVRFDFRSRETGRTVRIVLSLVGLKDYGELEVAGPTADEMAPAVY